MKKLLLLAVVAVAWALPVFAESYGIGLIFDVDNYSYKVDAGTTFKASDDAFEIGVKGYYFKDNGKDFFGGVSYYSNTEKDSDSITGSIADDFKSSGVTVLGGINQKMVSSGPFSAGLGGQVDLYVGIKPSGDSAPTYDKYSNLYFALSIPATFDVIYSEHIMTRLRGTLIRVSGTQNSYTYKGSTVEYTNGYFDINVGNSFGIDFIYKF